MYISAQYEIPLVLEDQSAPELLPDQDRDRNVALHLGRGIATLALVSVVAACGPADGKTSEPNPLPVSLSTAGSLPPSSRTVDVYYAGGSADVVATGASVSLLVARPKVGSRDYHSLSEIALRTDVGVTPRANGKDAEDIELGWTVDPQLFHDNEPHLFVFPTKDGVQDPKCYNNSACGFVQLPGTIKAGAVLPVGEAHRFGIYHSDQKAQWQVYYDGIEFGYMPDSYWKTAAFKRVAAIAIYGEVMANDVAPRPCTQMGDGGLGAADKDAITQPSYRSPDRQVRALALMPFTNPQTAFYAAQLTANGIHFGGPGAQC